MKPSHKNTLKFSLIFSLLFVLFSCSNTDKQNISDKQSKNSGINKTDTLTIETISKEIRKNPENDELFYKRSKLYVKKNDIKNAINDMKIALKLDSLKPSYYIQMSGYQLLKGNSDDSKSTLERCIKIFPKNTNALLKLSNIYFYVKNYKQAFKYLNKVQQIDKHIAQTYFIKSLIYKEVKDTSNAIKNLQIAVDNQPDYYEAYMLLGLLYAEKHDSIAVDYYKNAIKIVPKSIEAHYNTAFFYQENNKYKKAINEYNYILNNIDSTQQNVYYNIGYVYLIYLNEYNKAISYFSKAIKYNNKYYQAYYNKGYCYELLKQYNKAREQYKTSLNIYPNYNLSIKALNRLDKIQKK